MLKCRVFEVYDDLRGQKVWLKFFNCVDHCEQLLFGGSVVLLSPVECTASIVDNTRILVLPLPQDHPDHMVISTAYNLERNVPIRRLDDGCSDKSFFEPVKCFKTLVSKNKRVIFS